MAITLQLRRGTSAQIASLTGESGEVMVDTSKKTVVVHDGSTAGGFPLALESDIPVVPTATSDLTNDSGFITSSALTGLATESYVDTAVAGVSGGSVDLTGYATETYVNDSLANFSTGYITNGIASVGIGESGELVLSTTNSIISSDGVHGHLYLDYNNGPGSPVGTVLGTDDNSGGVYLYTNGHWLEWTPNSELKFPDGSLQTTAYTGPTDLTGLQETLVSGTNIKTINGTSILGSGDITISGGTGGSSVEILTPTNVAPTDALTGVTVAPTLTASTYYSLYGKVMQSSQWQVATDSGFSTIVYENVQSGTSVTHQVGSDLTGTTTFYWRVRYKDVDGVYSEWSTATSFTTESSNIPALGSFYEGGYYGGKLNINGTIYLLIVSPKSTETTLAFSTTTDLLQYNGSNAAAYEIDGPTNTMELALSPTASAPAAEYCYDLSVNGYSDWYLPAQLELDILYYNLKPTTDENSAGYGVNAYSVPTRTTAWTTTNPGQTSISAFQQGGAQAFDGTAGAIYTASNQASYAPPGYNGTYKSFWKGFNAGATMTDAFYVRAIRRVLAPV